MRHILRKDAGVGEEDIHRAEVGKDLLLGLLDLLLTLHVDLVEARIWRTGLAAKLGRLRARGLVEVADRH